MDPELVRRARELLPKGEVYCDWAASALALPPSAPTFIPPHHSSSEVLEKARAAVRKFLNDSEENYHIVFTAGTTASFQVLAYRIPWSHDDAYICHRHVHNAVLGIRNVAVSAGAEFHSVSTKDMTSNQNVGRRNKSGFAVFAFPGECNLTGNVYPLSWAERAKSEGMLGYPAGKVITIVDTAKLVAHTPFSLDEHPYVDALAFSLYKLSSTYTGLGFLLIRKNTLLEQLLHSSGTRSFFGGQSSDAITPFSTTLHVPSPSLERALSSGTPNLQAIQALPGQLGHMANMAEIGSHAKSVGIRFRVLLSDAFPNVKIYEDCSLQTSFSTISFTLFRAGAPIGHHEIATILSLNGVHVRAGTMCNIGATADVLGLSDTDLVELHRRGHRCGEGVDVVDGRPTGVVRVSFGWGSTLKDADTVARVLREYVGTGVKRVLSETGDRVVRKLFVYPLKGCPGTEVESVSCARGGLKGDRTFGVIDKRTGKVLDVKSCPNLAEMEARYVVDCDQVMLAIRHDCHETHMDVNMTKADARVSENFDEDGTCGAGIKLAAEVECESTDEWLSQALGRPARLAVLHGYKRDALVVTEEEIEEIAKESWIETNDVMRAIRPNVVLSGGGVSADLMTLTGSVVLTRMRRCTRCTMVNINAGASGGEPLRSIARICRRQGGGLVLGAVMRASPGFIKVGDVMKSVT